MGIGDFLEPLGSTVAQLGMPTRRNTPALVTGLSTAAVAAGNAIRHKRARGLEKKSALDRKAVEDRIGVPYDFFLKLSKEAQTEILRNAGLGDSEPSLPEFGGRTMRDLELGGAPAKTEMAGGSGVFSGVPEAPVQTGPALPPLKGVTGKARLDAMQAYLGGSPEVGISPKDESLIRARADETARRAKLLPGQIRLNDARTRQAEASAAAMRALGKNRASAGAPISDGLRNVAKQMGVIVPDGPVSQSEFKELMKFNRPASAVVGRTSDLSYSIREAELEDGREWTDQEIAKFVQQQTTDLPALSGPNATQIVATAVKTEVATLRRLYSTGVLKEQKDTGTGVPDSLDDGLDDEFQSDDEDYEGSTVPGY